MSTDRKTLIVPFGMLHQKPYPSLIMYADKVLAIESNGKRYRVIKDRHSSSKVKTLGHTAFIHKELK